MFTTTRRYTAIPLSLSLQIFVKYHQLLVRSLFHHRLHSWECKTSRQNIVEGNCWNRVAPSPTLIKLTADEAVIAQLIIIYAALKENCYTLIRYANHQAEIWATDFPSVRKNLHCTTHRYNNQVRQMISIYTDNKIRRLTHQASSQCIVNPQRRTYSSRIHFLCVHAHK